MSEDGSDHGTVQCCT